MANYEKLYNLKDTNGELLGQKFTKKGTNTALTLSEFGAKYFSDANGVKKIYDIIDDARNKWPNSVYTKVLSPNIQQFYKDYVCDLQWATSTSYCAGNFQIQVDNNDYVGEYTDKATKTRFSVRLEDNSDLTIYAFGQKTNLLSSAPDIFKIQLSIQQFFTISGTITFKRDQKTGKVSGFTYKLDNVPPQATTYLGADFKAEGEAVKYVGKSGSLWSDKPSDWLYFTGQSSNPYGNKSDVKQQQQNKNNISSKTDDVVNIPLPKNIHACDPNADAWEIGCSNGKIEYMNEKILGQKLNGVYTETLRNYFINNGMIDANTVKLPREIFNRVLKNYEMNLNESKVDKINLKRFYNLVNKKL